MALVSEDAPTESSPTLLTAREPTKMSGKKPPKTGNGSIGEMAVNDGVMIVAGAWLLLILMAASLNRYNV